MKVLVTGGTGFIGSHIVDMLVNDGADDVIVDDLSSGSEKNIHGKAVFHKLDIQDSALENIFRKEQPDYVFYEAVQIDVRRSVSDPVFDARVNVLGSINIFENCIKHKVKKVVFASSGYIDVPSRMSLS